MGLRFITDVTDESGVWHSRAGGVHSFIHSFSLRFATAEPEPGGRQPRQSVVGGLQDKQPAGQPSGTEGDAVQVGLWEADADADEDGVKVPEGERDRVALHERLRVVGGRAAPGEARGPRRLSERVVVSSWGGTLASGQPCNKLTLS